jgi:hypothetical protein
MIATALLALATGVASAQALQANIPFAFRVGNKVMAPGTYRVQVSSGPRLVILSNYEAKATAILAPTSTGDPSKEWKAAGAPMLSFDCGASRCELNRLWTGDAPALNFMHRNRGPEQRAVVTEIRLVRAAE